MPAGLPFAEPLAPELAGDAAELLAQLGAPDALPALAVATDALAQSPIHDAASLHGFLASYRDQLLLPGELPAILAAHGHAHRGELRELLALDRALAADPRPREFRVASAATGRRQLNRLRPLRDQRLVQRYARAVDEAQAHGWHTLVFGVFLSQYSLPLRQGLLLFAHRTLGGFLDAGGAALRLPLTAREELFAAATAPLAPAVNALLAPQSLASPGPCA